MTNDYKKGKNLVLSDITRKSKLKKKKSRIVKKGYEILISNEVSSRDSQLQLKSGHV